MGLGLNLMVEDTALLLASTSGNSAGNQIVTETGENPLVDEQGNLIVTE